MKHQHRIEISVVNRYIVVATIAWAMSMLSFVMQTMSKGKFGGKGEW